MKKPLLLLALISFNLILLGQSDDEELEKIGSQIFLPSVEIGYMFNHSDDLGGGFLTKTSLEYRIRNNNDLFFRLNYDKFDAEYNLNSDNNLTPVIKGTAVFSDILGGVGYREGDAKFRGFLLLQAGSRLYNFPVLVEEDDSIIIEQAQENIFTSRITVGAEYYLNEKSAFVLDVFHGQIWENRDWWSDSGMSYGASLGFITTLF